MTTRPEDAAIAWFARIKPAFVAFRAELLAVMWSHWDSDINKLELWGNVRGLSDLLGMFLYRRTYRHRGAGRDARDWTLQFLAVHLAVNEAKTVMYLTPTRCLYVRLVGKVLQIAHSDTPWKLEEDVVQIADAGTDEAAARSLFGQAFGLADSILGVATLEPEPGLITEHEHHTVRPLPVPIWKEQQQRFEARSQRLNSKSYLTIWYVRARQSFREFENITGRHGILPRNFHEQVKAISRALQHNSVYVQYKERCDVLALVALQLASEEYSVLYVTPNQRLLVTPNDKEKRLEINNHPGAPTPAELRKADFFQIVDMGKESFKSMNVEAVGPSILVASSVDIPEPGFERWTLINFE